METVGCEMLIIELSGGVVWLCLWLNKTSDGRCSLGDPTDILYLFAVSLHHVLPQITASVGPRWLE